MDRQIIPVKDNKDKANTYKTLMTKYSKAVENECFFEAMLIVYAFLEDRLRSYLFYIGALKATTSIKFDNEVIKKEIKSIVDTFSGDDKPNLGITNISGKIRIVKSVNRWYKEDCINADSNGYLTELAECLDTLVDADEMLDVLEKLDTWCEYRNEVIHSVLNKNLESLYSDLGNRVETGMEYGRIIDKQVSALKRKNSIRKYLKLK